MTLGAIHVKKEYISVWRSNNPEKIKTNASNWRSNNPERAKEQKERDYIKNLNKRKETAANYKKERYGLGAFDTTLIWHIDHIIPCSSAKSKEELVKLQHYTNLQYLTKEDNLKKSNSLTWNTKSEGE